MFPTHKMIEAACNAAKAELYPSEFAMRAALTAALALLPGQPVGWRWRLPSDDFWQFTDGPEKPRLGLPKKTEDSVIFEPVYAAPAPLHVAVKELIWSHRNEKPQYDISADCPFGRYHIANRGDAGFGWLRPRSTVFEGFEPSLSSAKAAAQADYETRIRSALSSPVGGMEERKEERVQLTKEGAADAARDLLRKNGWKPGDTLSAHSVSQLMAEFAVMVDRAEIQCGWPDCGCCADAACRDAVTYMERASDIAAMREENERLRKALEPFALISSEGVIKARKGYVSPTTLAEYFHRASSALQHVAKGER